VSIFSQSHTIDHNSLSVSSSVSLSHISLEFDGIFIYLLISNLSLQAFRSEAEAHLVPPYCYIRQNFIQQTSGFAGAAAERKEHDKQQKTKSDPVITDGDVGWNCQHPPGIPGTYHWLADSNFPAQFTVKNVVCFQTFSTQKNCEILKAFSPLFNFLSSFSPQTRKVVKMFWVFHLVSS
jgi:hypothetical protein